MGTTMTYIQLKNRGFTSQELQACMDALFSGKTQEQQPLKDLERGMEALKGEKLTLKDRAILKMLHSAMKREDKGPKGPQVGFRPDAPWLPFWHTRMCEGSIQSSQTLRRLSEAFRTLVLAFALFDSDVLFVSYWDNAAGEACDYAKLPPWEGYEEYDKEIYRLGFPEFLAELCPPERREELRQVWETDSEDDVFADDRMWKLMELLGMEVIDPEAGQFPEGFQRVTPAKQ